MSNALGLEYSQRPARRTFVHHGLSFGSLLSRCGAKSWTALPRSMRFVLSRLDGWLFAMAWTRALIKPYCHWQFGGTAVLARYQPGSGSEHYHSFQDFFTRRLRALPLITSAMIWPCDGILCDIVELDSSEQVVAVKGESLPLRRVFGAAAANIPTGYFYTNVFLHNRDYHRVHSPVAGRIVAIEHIRGDLLLLRPWLNPGAPSRPAITNERVIISLKAEDGHMWYLAIVGGPGVATIKLHLETRVDGLMATGQEVAWFEIGSTCCVAAPVPPRGQVPGHVQFGNPYS